MKTCGQPDSQLLAQQATAHVMPAAALQPQAQFRQEVSELSVSRLLLALERDTVLRRTPRGRWVGSPRTPAIGNLKAVIEEAVRTGLVRQTSDDELVPADIHACAPGQWRSLCRTPGEGMGPKRVRLAAHATMVDCPACKRLL